jgi:putative heme-binding domain-containing protein
MPPNPQHTVEQTRLMVDWVLGLATSPAPMNSAGCEGGYIPAQNRLGPAAGGILLLKASYTDKGTPEAPPQTGEADAVLHSRRTRAEFRDSAMGALVVHDLEAERGQVVRFAPGDSIVFTDVDLAGIDAVTARLGAAPDAEAAPAGAALELHVDSPTGPLLATFAAGSQHQNVRQPVRDPGGLHDLYFTAKGGESTNGSTRKSLSLTWVEFHDSPAAAEARATARKEARRRIAAAPQATPARKVVRSWTVDDLTPHLAQLDAGRSLDRGKQLFQTLACSSCHRLAGSGGLLGPDLTDVVKRLSQKEPNVRAALLREVVDPSKVIDPKYRTRLIETSDGERLAGIVVEETDAVVRVAANAARPDEVRTIPKSQIERMKTTDVSLMPVGLLNVLTLEEILDLLAFVERGGK